LELLLAFNVQKFMGSRDPDHAHFSATLVRVMSGLSLGARLPNLKFISLAVSELLAFNAQKITGSRDPGHANGSQTFVNGHRGTVPGTRLPNLKFVPLAVLELLAFNARNVRLLHVIGKLKIQLHW